MIHRTEQAKTFVSSRSLPLWLVPIQLASAATALAVASGGQALRGLFLGGTVWLLGLPLLVSLEAGLIALMLFEPFRGVLRRAQYLIVPYAGTDPIHVLTPVITIFAFVLLLRHYRFAIFHFTQLAIPVSLLGLICFVQIFNPLQGSLLVGLSGALFILVPMAWFYFGQVVEADFVSTALRLMVVLSLLTSLHGLYQIFFGYLSFEQYWADHTEFYESIGVGNVQRALATFSSAEEWGRYMTIGSVVSFGFGINAKKLKRNLWFMCGAALFGVLLLAGQRTSIFALMLGLVTLVLLGARTLKDAARRSMLLLALVAFVIIAVKAPTESDMLEKDADQVSETMLSHSLRGMLRPAGEGSVAARFENWTYLATHVVPYKPLGLGLGATSVGMKRFNFEGSDELRETDGHIIGLIISCGLPTALFCLWILCRAAILAWRVYCRQPPHSHEAGLWRVVTALMSVIVLTTIFANTLRLYSVAPVAWLLIGWISAESTKAVEQQATQYSDAGVL